MTVSLAKTDVALRRALAMHNQLSENMKMTFLELGLSDNELFDVLCSVQDYAMAQWCSILSRDAAAALQMFLVARQNGMGRAQAGDFRQQFVSNDPKVQNGTLLGMAGNA